MIILDAGILIAHLDPADAHHNRAEQLLLDARGQTLHASPINMAEALVAPARAQSLTRALAIFSEMEVQTVPFPSDSPVLLALLRVETGLRMPDCCVLLAAEVAGGSIATFDRRLAAVATARGHTVLGVQ